MPDKYILTDFPAEIPAADINDIPMSDIERDFNVPVRALKEIIAAINGEDAGLDSNGDPLKDFTGEGLIDLIGSLSASPGDELKYPRQKGDGSGLEYLTANEVFSDLSASLVGSIVVSATDTPLPGTLKANGANVSRTTYSRLFDRIGTVFGAGDGSTTFTLPDLRGEFIRSWDDGRGVDSGRTFGSFQGHAFTSHTHSYNNITQAGASWFTGVSGVSIGPSSIQTGSPSTGSGSETRPRNIALLACIVY